jgi:hypothetical protein
MPIAVTIIITMMYYGHKQVFGFLKIMQTDPFCKWVEVGVILMLDGGILLSFGAKTLCLNAQPAKLRLILTVGQTH